MKAEDQKILEEKMRNRSISEKELKKLLAAVRGLYEPDFNDIAESLEQGREKDGREGLRFLIDNLLAEGVIEFSGRKVEKAEGKDNLSFAYRVSKKYDSYQ